MHRRPRVHQPNPTHKVTDVNRKDFTRTLAEMIQTIESDYLPEVEQLYVFGSYARGALHPFDLDVLVVYRHPEPKCQTTPTKRCAPKRRSHASHALPVSEDPLRSIRNALQRIGERVHLYLSAAVNDFLQCNSNVNREDLVLLWSQADRDWQLKLAGILPNSNAEPTHHDDIFPLHRLDDDRGTMQRVVQMIADRRLVLTRVPVATIVLRLGAEHQRLLQRWNDGRVVGPRSLETLPYAMMWMRNRGLSYASMRRDKEIWNESQTYCVHLGRPSLVIMLAWFNLYPKLKQQCLIPYFVKKGPNELLIFKRGPTWTADDSLLPP